MLLRNLDLLYQRKQIVLDEFEKDDYLAAAS